MLELQVSSLSLQLDGLRQRVEDKKTLEENLATSLQLADRYKAHLLKEQGHLYTCHLSFYKVVFASHAEESVPCFPGEKSAEGGWELLCIFTPKARKADRGDPPPKSGRSKDQARKQKYVQYHDPDIWTGQIW